MSRYIDKEWIRNVYADFEHYDNRNDWTTPIANVLAAIDDAPSIDIVRCAECRHWSGCKSTMHNNHRCGRAEKQNVDYWTRADDFCSYGEREGE